MGFIKTHITDPIRQAVVDEIRKQIPVLAKVVVLAITETLRQAAVSKVDEITNAIPGELDDQIIDPLITRITDVAKRLGL